MFGLTIATKKILTKLNKHMVRNILSPFRVSMCIDIVTFQVLFQQPGDRLGAGMEWGEGNYLVGSGERTWKQESDAIVFSL